MAYDDDTDPEGPSADDVARFGGDDAEHGLFPDELPGAEGPDDPPRPQWVKLIATITVIAFVLAIMGWMAF